MSIQSQVECYDRFNRPVSKRNVECIPEEGRTHQEFKDECDINRIMADVIRNGIFPPSVPVGRYGDFSDVEDFQAAQELLKRAQGQFAGLPSKVRDRFKNDPGKFLEWLGSKDNLEEANELGLLNEETKKRIAADKEAKSVKEPPK